MKDPDEEKKRKAEYNRAYRAANKEKLKEARRVWGLAHPNYEREWRERQTKPVKTREQNRMFGIKRREKHSERDYAYRREYNKIHKEKVIANNLVNSAVRYGKMTRLPCQICGVSDNVEGHHPDYGKPLDVVWLCHSHHVDIHHLPIDLELHP